MTNAAMKCPKCESSSNRLLRVQNHRHYNYLRRRRECQSCSYKWSTLEIVEKELVIEVQDQ